MRRTEAIGILLLATGSTPVVATTPATAPNLASCARPKTPNSDLERKRPLPIPAGLRAILNADLEHYAIATLNGGTVCIDTSWIESVGDIAGSPDRRFVTYAWNGNEAYGYKFVDRAGRGQVIDTGAAPTFSPSHMLLAAVEMSESGFGSLNAFAVWRVEASGVREIGRVEDLPSMSDWRIDRWTGESCVALSALPLDAEQASKPARTRYAARPRSSGWSVSKGACPSA
jgi:hypothetical protein